MSKEDAEKASIPVQERRSYFRVDDGKTNMQPPVEKALWRKIVGVPLDNDTADDPGDWVGVVTSWTMPDALDGVTVNKLREVQEAVAAGRWSLRTIRRRNG